MKRKDIRLWSTAVALLLLIAAVWPYADSLYDLTGEEEWEGQLIGLIHWVNTAIRPQPRLAPEQVAAHTGSPFGVNTFLGLEAEPAKRARSLDLIRAAGFRFIRQEFRWEDIEIHGKGDFVDRRNDLDGDGQPDPVDAWAKYDQIVELATEREIEIIARLGNPPAWTRALTDTIGALAPPDDFGDYGDFTATVAERYRGQIRYYQIWNEPNGNAEWGNPELNPVNPEEYTELLCLAYRRIKEVDSAAVILAGALTPTVEVSGRNLNDLIFLQRMYAAGAGDCFDIFSAQGYGLWSGPTDQRLRPTVINYPHHMLLRDVMVRHDDGEKPIWISEMAWNVVPETLPARYGRVSLEQQARYAVGAYRRAEAAWPWIGVVNYWFFKRPHDREKDDPWYYFRLMEPDFTPLPVYEAIADYANPPPQPAPWPDWVYDWLAIRPLLFLLGVAILTYNWLTWLGSGRVAGGNVAE